MNIEYLFLLQTAKIISENIDSISVQIAKEYISNFYFEERINTELSFFDEKEVLKK